MLIDRIKTFLCSLPIAAILCWTITNLKSETVSSSSDTFSVGFGWPFKWIYQDFSRFSFGRYPHDVKVTWVKFNQLPTHVNWITFSLNVLLLSVVLTLIYNRLPLLLNLFRNRDKQK